MQIIWVSLIIYNACKVKSFWLHPKCIFEQAFHRLILLIQKNEKINILSVQLINLNFPPSSGTKKGSHEWHFDHFINIFWLKRTFTYLHKGQIKPKAVWARRRFSPNKRTKKFVLFAVKSKKANETNLFLHFMGESTAR